MNEHSKIIDKVAKQKLKPLGIVQKGKSIVWLDDRGWFTTVIEFQPSSWAKGAYLNIGANFHWHKAEHFGFDLGGREENNFVEYKNDEQFVAEMEKFCDLIIKKVLEFRENLKTIFLAKGIILKHNFPSEELWGNYHKGIICGLTSDFDELNKFFSDILKQDSIGQWTCGNTGTVHSTHIQWIDDLKEDVKYLLSKTSSLELFKVEILKIIAETRKLKKLPEIEIDL